MEEFGTPLVTRKKRKRTLTDDICILCKNTKFQSAKLTGTDQGRKNIIELSQNMNDEILSDLTEEQTDTFMYHLQCYRPYILKGGRFKQKVSESAETSVKLDDDSQATTSRSSRNIKKASWSEQNVGLCIVCNASKYQGDRNLFRISEVERAQLFLDATHFNMDSVFDRSSTLQDVSGVFAADIMCHKKCINRYIIQYRRDSEDHEFIEEDIPDEISEAFTKLIAKLHLDERGYTLSECRDLLISDCTKEIEITNRKIKQLLIHHFGETICFTYPRNQRTSQMFYSTNLCSSNLVETVRATHPVQVCAEKLRQECKNYDFGLDGKFCDSKDLSKAMDNYHQEPPETWTQFFTYLLPSYSTSSQLKRKCDSIFQIVYTIIHDGQRQTPMHISTAQTIHDTTRSRKLIRIFSRLGLCVSYDQLERQDHSLVARIIARAEGHRVPLPPAIKRSAHIRGSMDNFDHEEQTASGIGGSHDTVLVIFQDGVDNNNNEAEKDSLLETFNINPRTRALGCVLPCQQLLPCNKPKQRGDIPADFSPVERPNDTDITEQARVSDLVWFLCRFLTTANVPEHSSQEIADVPSWSAFNSLVSMDVSKPTVTAFTPILPYPATQYDTIFTCMVNFQDAMSHTGQQYGSIWCDEGVYRLAKELQLLLPKEQFSNIFIGLGGFHMEKVLMSCIGSYLEDSGAEQLFIENEIFGPLIVQSILNGSHYSRALRGLSMLAEVMTHLQWLEFLKEQYSEQLSNLFETVSSLQCACKDINETDAQIYFDSCREHLINIAPAFQEFVKNGVAKSDMFKYWNTFLTIIYPILKDLTRSHREGNWELHVSAVHHALPAFFAFNKTHYSRWGSVYYEDCLKLPETFPDMHKEFLEGHFVVKHTKRRFSSVPMDQALEQAYNKPAKGQGGVIGITRCKEAVAQHDLVKHEKADISAFLHQMCELDEDNEYSLHHEFSSATTKRDEKCIKEMVAYILEKENPFDLSGDGTLKNFVTGKHTEDERRLYLLDCMQTGEQAYGHFQKTRFEDKNSKLFDPIPKMAKKTKKSKQVTVDTQKETCKALHCIDIARTRGYSIAHLLTYELTSTSLYLTKEGYLRKPVKSDLSHAIEKKLMKPVPQNVPFPSDVQKKAIVIDFMAYSRKIPFKKLKLKIFDDVAANLWRTFSKMASNCERIDVVFDIYRQGGIKDFERMRRGKFDPIELAGIRSNTPLPVEMERFWASPVNKTKFQAFFIEWVLDKESIHPSRDSVPIYLGGGHQTDCFKCVQLLFQISQNVPSLHCHHEEADDRILFHVNQAVCVDAFTHVIVASPDTDVFACLLHHFNSSWKHSGLQEMWVLCGQGSSSRATPLHEILDVIPHELASVLPAVHALSGCDTTSKVATKQSALKAAEALGSALLGDFGHRDLSSDMEENAEKFLVNALGGSQLNSFNDLRYYQYHHKNIKNNFEMLVPTTDTMKNHIKRAYLQCHHWLQAADHAAVKLNPLDYGYELRENGILAPIISSSPSCPEDFPQPCKCAKCARSKLCPCRKANIECCSFCKCESSNLCQNPKNIDRC